MFPSCSRGGWKQLNHRKDNNLAEPELMSVSAVCERYTIGRTTLYREVAAGRIRLRKMGTATRIAREDMDAWMAALPVITGVAA